MRILRGFFIFLIALLPWTWMFTYHLWLEPVVGSFWGQASVFGVGAVVLLAGIYATRKGYGRQSPAAD